MRFSKLREIELSLNICNENSFSGEINGICTLSELQDNSIIFVKDKKYLGKLINNLNIVAANNICLITTQEIAQKVKEDNTQILDHFSLIATVDDVPLAMCHISKVFYDEMVETFDDINDGRENSEIDPSAQIAPNVFIGKNVSIGKNVKIHSGCSILSFSKIGDETVLYPNVSVYQNVIIGKSCRIHSNSTIGSDGFGYKFSKGVHHKIWHMGGVVIDDNVEIGSISAIDGGTFTPTRIKSGTKIDNGVQIGHNCNIGNGVIFCGHSGLSGSCTIGDYVVFGGKSGAGPDITLGDGCQIAGGSLVSKNWPAGSKLAGHPARPLREWFKANAFIRNGIKEK